MNIIVHTHLSPRIIEVLSPTTSVTVQEIVNVVRDWEDDNLSFDKLLSAAGKEALGGGVTVGITATLQNARLMFTGRTTPLESTGTCTSDELTGKILYATAGQFVTNGIYKGCTIKNHTTGSMATVTEVVSEIELKSFQITGGSRTTWLNGDIYDVYPNVQCSITGGNLVAVDSVGAELSPVIQSPNVQVVRSSSSSATLQELAAIQYASFGGGVTIDVVNGVPGTAYNIGTIENPSSNLTDAVTIANTRGFDTLFISKSMTLDNSTDIQNFVLIGKSANNTEITIESSAICNNIVIKSCNVTGILDGGTEINHCSIGDLTYVNGHIHESGLYGTIVLGGSKEAIITDCYTTDQDNPPTIDMGGSGQDLIMLNYSGFITIKNLTSDSEEIGVGIDAGLIVLDSTISAGTIVVSGTGRLTDNSTGTANVNTDGLMSRQTITEIMWDAVYIDTVNGYSGTTFPIGNINKQSNNINDALTIAALNDIKRLKIRGSITLPQAFDGWTLIGLGSLLSDTINLNSQAVSGCRFESLTVTGTLSSTDNQFIRCNLKDVIGLSGLLIDSALQGSITMGGPGSTITGQNIAAYGNTPGNPAIVNIVGAGRIFQASLDGAIYFTTAEVGSAIEVGLKNGTVILDVTCTGGTALFTGIGSLINYSAMTVTNKLIANSSVANAVWSENLNEYTTGAAKMQQAQMFGKEVVIDANVGVAGTDFPTGTRSQPVDNLTDALTICAARGLVRIMTRTSFIVQSGQNIDGIVIATHGILDTNIVFEAGCSAHKVTIRNANISGVMTLGDELFIESCSIGNLENFTGIMNLATFGQGCEIKIGPWALFIDCHCGGAPTNEPEINIGTGKLSIAGYYGNLKLTNKTGDNRTVATFAAGNVSIASSCIAGKIQILGIGEVEKDESGSGCQVDVDAALTNEYIADHIWDEMGTEHEIVGSFGNYINIIQEDLKRTLGLLHENIFIDNPIYDDDNNLESARVRIYSDSISVGTDTNIIGSYIITSIGSGRGKFTTWSQIKN